MENSIFPEARPGMPRGVKRRAAVEEAAKGGKKNPVRPEVVMAILLSLIECGRVPVIRYNSEGEAISTAVSSPKILFSLPWTGTGNSMSLPQGQSLIMLSRDPTCPMMYYDYNNLGGGDVAQQAIYNWQNFSASPQFNVPANQAMNLNPCWAVPSANYKPHGNYLMARTMGDRTYIQLDAPPGNADTGISKFVVTIPNQATLVVNDVIQVALYRLSEGVDLFVQELEFSVAVAGTGGNITFAVPITDQYRVRVNYTPVAGNTALGVTVTAVQTWSCGTLCCNQLPNIDTIWAQLNRFRILGANVDVINQTPMQFRGGSVVAAQVPGGTSQYITLQGNKDPYSYVSSLRQMKPRDFAGGYFGFIKPDGDSSWDWQRPYRFDSNNNVLFNRSDAFFKNGYLMIAISAPDLVTGTTTTTTRGQVTLDFSFSLEIDSAFSFLGYERPSTSQEEWEIAEEGLAAIQQHWEDPDWGKIWSFIKSAGRIGGGILSLIPHPGAQAIGRGTTAVVDVLDRVA